MAATTTTKKKSKPGRPADVPSALLRVVETGADGRPRTVHDVLVDRLRLGAAVDVAAAAAGVPRPTVYEWIAEGSRIAARIEGGQITEDDLTPGQAAAWRFAVAAVRAVADAETMALGNVVRLAQGGVKRTRRTLTRTTDTGHVETVTEETLPPDLRANVFLLERGFAERWGRRQQVEVVAGQHLGGAHDAPESTNPLPAFLAQLDEMERRRQETTRLLDGGADDAT